MKPIRLRLQAFGPYAKEAVIDFRELQAGGLFLIHGQTGAGKTSLLDGLCFALFSRASGADRTAEGLRSDFAAGDLATEATLEFALGDDIYRVTRRPKQLLRKKRGDGYTTSNVDGQLEKMIAPATLNDLDTPTRWDLVTAGAAKTDNSIGELLGMTEEQFRQVVVLPQGQFRKFLSSGSEAREELLETLFKTERFRLIGETLAAQSKALGDQLSKTRTERDALLASIDSASLEKLNEKIDETQSRLLAFDQSHGEIDTRFAEATKRLEKTRTLVRVTSELSAVSQKMATLTSKRTEIASIESKIQAAKQAAPVLEISRRITELQKAIAQLGSEKQTTEKALNARAGEIEKIGDIRKALELEKPEIEKLEHERSELRTIYPSVVSLNDEKSKLSSLSLKVTAAASKLYALVINFDSSIAVETKLRAETVTAQRAHATALKNLKLQFHLSQAARLAAELKTDEPCPVCGSLDHPKPATSSSRAPTLEEIEVSEIDLASFNERLNAHDANLARFELGKKSAESALKRVTIAYEKRSGTKVDKADLQVTMDALSSEQKTFDSTEAKVQQLEALIPERLRDLAAVKAEGARLGVRIDHHKAQSKEVVLALEAASQARAALESKIETLLSQETVRSGELIELNKSLEERLSKSSFKTLDAATAAALSDAEIAKLEHERNTFEKDWATAQSRNEELKGQLSDHSESELANLTAKLSEVESEHATLDRERTNAKAERLSLTERVKDWKSAVTKIEKLEVEIDELTKRYSVMGKLSATAAGHAPNLSRVNFQRYILASRLDEVLDQASRRLFTMSREQFTLKRASRADDKRKSAGLDLEVEDNLSGTTRPTASLSGGEGFLASLALALGLADVVQSHLGGVRLDAVFVDEGFGTLDPESLEQAMRILTDLQSGGRMVGIISHVPELRDQISRRLFIKKTPQGSEVNWEGNL